MIYGEKKHKLQSWGKITQKHLNMTKTCGLIQIMNSGHFLINIINENVHLFGQIYPVKKIQFSNNERGINFIYNHIQVHICCIRTIFPRKLSELHQASVTWQHLSPSWNDNIKAKKSIICRLIEKVVCRSFIGPSVDNFCNLFNRILKFCTRTYPTVPTFTFDLNTQSMAFPNILTCRLHCTVQHCSSNSASKTENLLMYMKYLMAIQTNSQKQKLSCCR